jgi:hypothetical protein
MFGIPTKDEATERYGVKKTGTATVLADSPLEQVVQMDDCAAHIGRMFLTGFLRAKGAKVGDRVTMEYIVGPSSGLWYGGAVIEKPETPAYHAWHLARLDEGEKPLAKFSIIRDWSCGPVAYLNVDLTRANEVSALIGAVPQLIEAAFRLAALNKPDKNGVRPSPTDADIEAANAALAAAFGL